MVASASVACKNDLMVFASEPFGSEGLPPIAFHMVVQGEGHYVFLSSTSYKRFLSCKGWKAARRVSTFPSTDFFRIHVVARDLRPLLGLGSFSFVHSPLIVDSFVRVGRCEPIAFVRWIPWTSDAMSRVFGIGF